MATAGEGVAHTARRRDWWRGKKQWRGQGRNGRREGGGGEDPGGIPSDGNMTEDAFRHLPDWNGCPLGVWLGVTQTRPM